MNRWFTRYLYGVQNGVENDPKAWIVREGDPPPPPPPPGAAGEISRPARTPTPPPTPYADYPHPDAAFVTLKPQGNGSAVGTLQAGTFGPLEPQTLIDNVEFGGPALAKAEQSPHRLLYATAPLAAPLHISGTPRVTIRLASSKPAANLSVWLVVLPWTDGPIGPWNLITRGWADPQNYKSLTDGRNFDSKRRGEPLAPGRFYSLTFSLQPDDQIIPAGKRIGLMIFSSDRDFTLWPKPGTELTIDLDGTSLQLPIVGGSAAFARASSSAIK
jgi:X-Pro dipeptidyl-peptidase